MRFEMRMPDLATTESEIRILRWLVQPGQQVERGQPLLEVETDKAIMEVESAVSGMLEEVRCQADEQVSVGQVIAVFEVPQAASAPRAPTPERPGAVECASLPAAIAASPARDSGGTTARGMFARNRASAAPELAGDGLPLTPAQRTAAKRLQASKQEVPHFYLQTSANVSAILARIKTAGQAGLVWDAFFVLAVARAIRRFDRFCRRLEGEQLVRAESDSIGLAVDHDGELYVVPIASPNSKTVERISEEIRRSAEQVRRGDGEARRIHPALMTVTNLGACNVENFLPIINPPEVAILGVGRAKPTPVVRERDRIGVEHRCTLTLSVDHRVASGRYAGEFLGAIVEELESM